jgi:hypothetical protein
MICTPSPKAPSGTDESMDEDTSVLSLDSIIVLDSEKQNSAFQHITDSQSWTCSVSLALPAILISHATSIFNFMNRTYTKQQTKFQAIKL